ncbi:hypothetical protein [Kitasatospora sp. NPDC059571]|uniref:hypothetical protein n=1 Tax=Kitasatospora sp. NPDC059571 TaxID=3346871 RepID=UPI00367B33AE
MGGSGKTALAVCGAHRLATRYPDGQLHIDLRGFTPGQEPLEPSGVLAIMLRTLGVPGERIPDDQLGRINLWRTTTAKRRLLVLLDNALDAEQVRPLLPASPGSLVLITSRVRLVNLDGVEPISLGRLDHADCRALVERVLGTERVAAEPDATDDLIRLCGHLPLALRISSARLRNRRRWTIQYLVDRLRDESRTLDELSSGDRSVAATLRLSYLAMDAESRTAFRLLGLYPGTDLDAHTAAALFGTGVVDADDLLELLLDAHLLEQYELGRYAFHDLVRSFARSLRDDTAADADRAALERLLDHYVLVSEAASDVLLPGRLRFAVVLPEATAELPVIRTTDSALDWFAREQQNLLAALDLAVRTGLHRPAACLPRGFAAYLYRQGRREELLRVGAVAVAAARQLDEPLLLRLNLTNHALGFWQFGRLREGIDCLDEAMEIAVRIGDRHGEADCLSRLGLFHTYLGQFALGSQQLKLALPIHRELGSLREEASALISISAMSNQLGEFEEGAEAAREAIDLHRRLGILDGEALSLINLADAHIGLGEYDTALAHLTASQELYDQVQRPVNAELALARAAEAHYRAGRTEQALELALRAVQNTGPHGPVLRQAQLENALGRIQNGRGDHASALERHRRARRLAEGSECLIELAHALDGLALASAALGDEASAADHRARADRLFAELGVPDRCRYLS